MDSLTYWLLLLALYLIGKWYADYLKRCPYEDEAADRTPGAASANNSSHGAEKNMQRAAGPARALPAALLPPETSLEEGAE